MPKRIRVTDSFGKPLTPTYFKRANGLVKVNRAQWVSEGEIKLITERKDEHMNEFDNRTNGPMQGGDMNAAGYGIPSSPYFTYNDEELYKLARKRVNQRNGLLIHIIAYMAVNVFLFFIAISNGEFWNFYVLGGWGIGLVCHIGSYFFSSSPEAIHREFIKLKGGRY